MAGCSHDGKKNPDHYKKVCISGPVYPEFRFQWVDILGGTSSHTSASIYPRYDFGFML